MNTFFGPGGIPSIDLANVRHHEHLLRDITSELWVIVLQICNKKDNATFPGTQMPICTSVGADIKTCQAKGKIVTLSLGGAGGSVGFTSDQQGEDLADQIWDMFLGGSSSTRPFGDAVMDGYAT